MEPAQSCIGCLGVRLTVPYGIAVCDSGFIAGTDGLEAELRDNAVRQGPWWFHSGPVSLQHLGDRVFEAIV